MNPLRRTSTRKFVEALRRQDNTDGYESERYGQTSRAFSPKLGKPFANIDQWPPPANYRGKGHKKPAMAKTSLLQKPRWREIAKEDEVEPGWTRVMPPGEGKPLADSVRAKGFKKVKHYAGGSSGGVPSWIMRKEQARLEAEARGEVVEERDSRLGSRTPGGRATGRSASNGRDEAAAPVGRSKSYDRAAGPSSAPRRSFGDRIGTSAFSRTHNRPPSARLTCLHAYLYPGVMKSFAQDLALRPERPQRDSSTPSPVQRFTAPVKPSQAQRQREQR